MAGLVLGSCCCVPSAHSAETAMEIGWWVRGEDVGGGSTRGRLDVLLDTPPGSVFASELVRLRFVLLVSSVGLVSPFVGACRGMDGRR